jgi:hypothetical protein
MPKAKKKPEKAKKPTAPVSGFYGMPAKKKKK